MNGFLEPVIRVERHTRGMRHKLRRNKLISNPRVYITRNLFALLSCNIINVDTKLETEKLEYVTMQIIHFPRLSYPLVCGETWLPFYGTLSCNRQRFIGYFLDG